MNDLPLDLCSESTGTSDVIANALESSGGIFELVPVGVYACDSAGHIVRHNRRAAELWGQNPQGAGQVYCGAYRSYTPDGRPLALAETPMAELLRDRRPIRNRELVLERPDGSRSTVLVDADPLLDSEGTMIGGVSSMQDITARRTAEEMLQGKERWYRDLLEALPAAIYTTDADGRLTFFNQAAAELCGRQPKLGADEWCVSWRLYRRDGTPLALQDCPMALALKEERAVRGAELVAERPDGTRLAVLPHPTPLYDSSSGALLGAVNMLLDISDRKLAEQQKLLLLRELAHRVNNTFAVILAITQQSLRSSMSPQQFADSFTGRLQALARAHNLLLEQDWTGADLGELARGELAAFGADAGERFSARGPKIMVGPAQVIALAIVLHELGTNARKYGALSVEGGRIELSWEVHEENGLKRANILWKERDGPIVSQPLREGLGGKLIQRGLPHARVDWDFAPAGVSCRIDLPLEPPKQSSATDQVAGEARHWTLQQTGVMTKSETIRPRHS